MTNIRLVCFDFDGVFTDGKIYEKNNCLNKYYNVKDGMGLALLKKHNMMSCLISNFKSKFNVLYNDNIIIEHLNFDIVSINNTNKIDTLIDIMQKNDLTWDNVAYIGDDANDIDVMTMAGFSACPNDAIQECKNIANFICDKKGGEGCVREFIDVCILNKSSVQSNVVNHNKIIDKLKLTYNNILNYITVDMIELIISNIVDRNNIYCCGVGKSGNVVQHMVDIMKSINLSAHVLNCMNAIHGDIGSIKENDAVIFFSKSGNTNEILNIIDFIKMKKCKTILISCNKINNIGKKCDIEIILPNVDEFDGNINCIPTNSVICMITFCNIIVGMLSDKINNDIYISNHPAGMIGYNMRTIKDTMITHYPQIVFNNTVSLNYVLLEMTKYSIGCCFFIDNYNTLLGLMTDGDIRRMLVNNSEKKQIYIDDINRNYHYETAINKKIIMVNNLNRYKFIPILDNYKMIGVLLSTPSGLT